MTIHRSDRVSTENGWKSILLENVNHFNLNRFGLKRLIPIEHDLNLHLKSKTTGKIRHTSRMDANGSKV